MNEIGRQQAQLLDTYSDELQQDTGAETPAGLDPEIADTLRRLRASVQPPEPAPAFALALANRLDVEAARLAAARVRQPRESRDRFGLVGGLFAWPRGLAVLAAALVAVIGLALYFDALKPREVNADEIVRKAQAAASSPAASGITSFVSTDTYVSRPGNPRMNRYASLLGDEQIRNQTKRWYEAPNRWRAEGTGTILDAHGQEMPGKSWSRLSLSDGVTVWNYDVTASAATVSDVGVSATGKPDTYGAESPLGEMDLEAVLQLSNPNFRPKLQKEETVAGRPAYVLAFPTGTPSASAPEMSGPRTVWADKETYFVLKVVQISGTDGKWLSTSEVTSIRYNAPIDPVTFSFTPPVGAKVDDQRPKPAPTRSEFQVQMEGLAKQTDFPLFLPAQVPDGLLPREPKLDGAQGLRLEYATPAEVGAASFPSVRITEQKATSDLAANWTEGSESISIGNARGWLRRGVRAIDGTGTDSAAMVLRDGTLVSVASFAFSPDELVKVAASLEAVPGGHAPLPNPAAPVRTPRPTPSSVPAPAFTVLRPTWLPEQMKAIEQRQPDSTGHGTEVMLGFDPRPDDQRPHGVLMLTEVAKGSVQPLAGKPDPGEIHETIAGRDVTVIMRGNDWITLSWIQGDAALTLTNPYDPPGHPRYSPEQLTRIVESIR